MTLSTRSIVVAGILIAITILLSVTGIGYITVPNVTGAATYLQAPTIIGGVLEGPLVGALVGLVFGITSYFAPGVQALFVDKPFWVPIIVLLLPRILVGVVAWYVYAAMRKNNEVLALGTAAVAGTLTNTVGVLGLGVLLKVLPASAIVGALPQVVVELVVVTVLVIAVVAAYKGIAPGRHGSTV